ncbi:MAG: hypothetical protein OXE52_07020 [Chloroflexi bacterium]|nr:hypothetical protein [Chloroflexota bacterium]
MFPYYLLPNADEDQQRKESRRRFNRARFERIRRRWQLQDRTRTLTAEQLEYQHDSEAYRRPTSAPLSRPSTRPTPTSSPRDYADPPASQSSGQASSSDSGKQSNRGSERADEKKKSQKLASSQQSPSGFPQDIEWDPDISALGLVTFIQTAGEGTRDSSEDKTNAVCEALHAADPAGVARGIKIVTGCEPDDEEQDIVQELKHILQTIAPLGLFEDEPWYSTKLSSPESLAVSAATEPTTAQGQVHAGIGGSDQPEISLLLQWGLSEAFSGEWDPRWTEKEHLQDFLVSDLKQNIHGYDETARVVPGFDETVINWADLTVEEMMALYRVEIALELAARGEHYEGLPPEYDEIKASLGRATELESLAGPIPLDDTQAYAAKFAGRVRIEDAEDEREHVQDQLAVIYEHLNIEMPENHLEGRSTTELKYELYYRLNYDVPQFMGLDANEKDNRIGDFLHAYHGVARDNPEGVIDRLQGTFHQPDVLGFLFVMGLSIAFEPVDWALTAVDVIDALSEGDVESAIGNAILGAAPIVNSKLDDLVQPFLKRIDNIPLLPARAGLPPRHVLRNRGFTDEMIDMIEYRGATGPGTDLAMHNRLLKEGPEHTSAVTTRGDRLGHRTQDANAHILREQYGYNVINEPNAGMLEKAGIDSSGRTPDYFIEGRSFDAYTVRSPRNPNAPEKKLIETVWNALYDKVPRQTNRLVIDLSNTPLTSERFIADLSSYYAKGLPLEDPMLAALQEIKFMRDGRLTNIWVKPIR